MFLQAHVVAAELVNWIQELLDKREWQNSVREVPYSIQQNKAGRNKNTVKICLARNVICV